MHNDEVVVINFIKLREGVPTAQFVSFAETRDLPIWRAKDVVLSFDTYRVLDEDVTTCDVDFVEVMHVRSWSEWEFLSRNDPDVTPLEEEFGALAEPRLVRTVRVKAVERLQG